MVYKGQAQFFQNLYVDAVTSYDKSISISKNQVAWSKRGQALDRLGKYDEAIDSFNIYLNNNPNDSNVWYARGQSLANSGKLDESIKSFDKAIETAYMRSNAWYSAWYAKGSTLESQEKHKEAIACFDEITKADENNSDAWNAKGLAQEKLGEKDEAQKSFDKSKKINQDKYASLVYDGIADLTNIRYDKALESFDKAILIDPDISDAWYNKGKVLYKLQRYSESISDFNAVNDIDPLNSDAWYYKGQALYNLQRYSEAIDAFDKVLNITKDNSEAWSYKGESLYQQGRFKEAIEPFDKSAQIAPKNDKALSRLHEVYANHTFDYEKALEISKTNADSSNFQDKVKYIVDLITTDQFEAARTEARTLEKATPPQDQEKNCIIKYLLLCTYFLQENNKKGSEELEKFRTYYLGIGKKDFKIGKEWSFRGLDEFILGMPGIQNKDKETMKGVLTIIEGKEGGNKALRTISQDLDYRAALNIKHQKRDRRLLLLSVPVFAIIAVMITSPQWAPLFFPKACEPPPNLNSGKYALDLAGFAGDILQNPSKPSEIFVVNSELGNISMLDTNCHKLVTISKTNIGNPTSLAFDNGILYIPKPFSNKISIIDTKTKEERNYPTSGSPVDVSVIDSTIYVANQYSNNVSVIKYQNNNFESMPDIPIGGPQRSLEATGNNMLYVLHQNEPVLSIINLTTDSPVRAVAVGMGAMDIKYNQKTDKVYIANSQDDSVSIVNPSNGSRVTNVIVGVSPDDLTIDQDTNDIYVTNYNSKTVSVIDGQNDSVKRTLRIEGSPVSVEYR